MSNHNIWGMIHVPALPGSYKHSLTFREIVDFCLEDATIFVTNGITHLFIENFWDVPYPKNTSKSHIIAAISIIAEMIKMKFPEVVLGINILRNDAQSALGIATITDSKAIRVNVLTHARITDQGIIEGNAHDLISYSQLLKAEVEIWADIDVKHSVSMGQVSTEDAVLDAIHRGGANKIIFSGPRTGAPPDREKILQLIKNQIISPELVVIGSGITHENIHEYLDLANNFIVGSSLKINNNLELHIDSKKVRHLLSKVQK